MSIDFSKLTFSVERWPLERWDQTIAAAERRVVCEIRDMDGKTEISDHRCSDAEWAKLESLLAKCNLSAWQDKYEGPVFDGKAWHLEILHLDGRVTRSSGLNGYPVEWRIFGRMCEYCRSISQNERIRKD